MDYGVVIVTYNRRELLKECLDCVRRQTLPFSVICVIDNHSTDGTAGFLDELAETDPRLRVFHLEKNLGGAGGFSFGLKQISDCGCHWVLIIDDDAMIEKTYMEALDRAVRSNRYLAYSGTVSTDGSIDRSHRRRIKNSCLMTYEPVPLKDYEKASFEYDISTFCGLLIKASLIKEIGLPRTDYFIWFDDTEYCLRFHRRSRILNVNDARLDHKTAPPGSGPVISWKHYYGFRNSIDIGKTYSSCPPVYLAYILANHTAHILLDSLGILFKQQVAERRYRRRIYMDVLKGLKQTPSGIDERYLPGSQPK